MASGDSARNRRPYPVQPATNAGDPYPRYAWFRAHDAVHVGDPGWPMGKPQVSLYRHAHVMRWLKDTRMIRRFTELPEYQTLRKTQGWKPPAPDTFADVSRRFMLFQDPPDHTRLRRIANRAFTPEVVKDRRDEIEMIAAGLLSEFREEYNGEGDLIEAFAYPLPVLVMARILGIPQADMYRFRTWSAVVGATIDTPTESLAIVQKRVDDATQELCEYLRSIVARRCEVQGEDLISRLIAARDDDGRRLTEEELVTMCVLLMTAGHETMANVIANGTLALMRHRDQWDRLVTNLSLVGNAAEELMRYDSPVQFTGRVAGDDFEIDGVRVARGSEVLFMLGSANRDETVWEDPDTVWIERPVRRHMAFGAGIHFCMGAPLARLEAEITLRTLASEAPDLALTDPAPTWRPILHGLQRLDVRLDA
jgi:cytochrome P450